MAAIRLRQDRTQILNYLWELQNDKGYISDSDVRRLSRELHFSVVEAEGILSFYHFFHRKPTGKYIVYLNTSMVAEVKGFQKVKDAFEKETGGKFGGVDPTGTFGLFETSCIGLSDQEPAALIDFEPFVNLTPAKVKKIVEALRVGYKVEDLKDTVNDNIYSIVDEPVFFRPYTIGAALKKLIKLSPEQVVEIVKESGLSGMGGAFFPTGVKWQFCRRNPGFQKYVICNADEGEPGTFKDRVLMNQVPGRMIEGMIIGAYAVGASKGIIYLRAEYKYLLEKLEETIEKFRDIGLLGENILGKDGFDFDIRIQLGAGAYICGEETALIESIEGERGAPRTKVYFPVEKGLFNKPTIVNNVETFCAVSSILELGAKNWNRRGTGISKGTKLISISGHCKKPGVYEIEWGISVKEILIACGAQDPHFIQISGPSGKPIPVSEVDRKLGAEDILCGGSFMIFNSKTDVFDILQNFSNFFIEESCGLCTPCRAGNYLIGEKLSRIRKGLEQEKVMDEIDNWSRIIRTASRCGLGKTSTNFLIEAIEKFPEVLKEKLLKDKKQKEFNVTEATQNYLNYTDKINNHDE
jgi:[NiFe] hydrogenase diaphorase moiety large subunit